MSQLIKEKQNSNFECETGNYHTFCPISCVSWLYQKIVRHTIWFWITTIVFSFLFTVSSFRNAFTLPKKLINTDIIVNRIAEVNPGSQPMIVYNNDKYLFIELNDFFFLHGKPANGAMLIIPIDDIFKLAESNYKLPEHTKAAYHYHLKEKQKEKKEKEEKVKKEKKNGKG